MGKILVQNYTTKNPISMIGKEAGICWGADTNDINKNYKRGLDCLRSGHMRTAEYPQVYIVLDGYSARVIRELYTHIGGSPTRLQASTRYINYENVDVVFPPKIDADENAKVAYLECMGAISDTYRYLQEECDIPKEDIANILPLGMETKIVLRTNLRHLIDMSHQRLCSRAYWEFRQLMNDLMKALREYSEEWATIVDEFFKPKCEVCGFCEERNTCGRKPTKERIKQLIELGLKYEEMIKAHIDDGK